MKTRSKNSAKGFTLIELLVAMAITTIIISILVSVTALSLDAWNRSRSEVRAARQGKAMIDSMARDFESLVIRKGNSFEWLFAESRNPSIDTDFPQIDDDADKASPNAINLIFFSAATDRYDGNVGNTDINPDTGKPYDLGGDVSTVGYQLAYKDPIADEDKDEYKTFILYRKIANPDVTFENILGQANIKAPFEGAVNTGDTVGKIDQEVNFICENVYEFTVTFHVRVTDSSVTPATVKTVRVPIKQGSTAYSANKFTVTGAGNIVAATVNGATADQIKSGQLSAVEISLTVLSDFGLKQLRVRTFADATEKAEFIAKNSYQYSKLVQVPGS